MLVLPIIAGGASIASKIIFFFYRSNYEPSVLAFQILVFSVAPIYFYQAFYRLFVVSGRQKQFLLVVAIGAASSLIFNFFLIPRFSLYGAAAVDVATNAIIFIVLAILAKKYTQITPFGNEFLKIFAIVVAATLVMLAVILNPAMGDFNVMGVTMAGAVVYFTALVSLGRIFGLKII